MKYDPNKFGMNLKLCRGFLGMTIHELAERSGLTSACISQVENNKREPTLKTACKLCNGVGADLDRLLR